MRAENVVIPGTNKTIRGRGAQGERRSAVNAAVQ